MTLIRGPSEEQEEGGGSRVGHAGPCRANRDALYVMQLLVVFNDLHRAPGHSGTLVCVHGGAVWVLFSSKKQHVSSTASVAENVVHYELQQLDTDILTLLSSAFK